jgi:hypothetical protein
LPLPAVDEAKCRKDIERAAAFFKNRK